MGTEKIVEGAEVKKDKKSKNPLEHMSKEQVLQYGRSKWAGRIFKVIGAAACVGLGYYLGKRSGMTTEEIVTKSTEVAQAL